MARIENLQLSDFFHVVKGQGDLVALYNSLTLGVVVIDRATALLFSDPQRRIISLTEITQVTGESPDRLVDALIADKLAFPLGQRPDLADYLTIQQGLAAPRIGILYLLLTDACNLDCAYCFVENQSSLARSRSLMAPTTVRYGLDLFARAVSGSEGLERPQVILYGGEPLANRPALEEALRYLRDLKLQGLLPNETTVTINTNGTLIDQSLASFLKGFENLQLAISLDGPKEVQDRLRPYRHGGGSFEDVMRGHRLLADAGVEAGWCCTITRQNVENLMEVTKWFVEELGAKSLGFNILIENPAVETTRGAAKEYAAKVASKIVECFRYLREQGVYEDRIMRKVNAFVEGKVYYRDCGGCGEQLVIAPDGMVGVCQGYSNSRKNFVQPNSAFDPLSHALWERWRFRSPLLLPECRGCIALAVCGGGCPFSAELRNGSIWALDDIFCEHSRATVTFLLQDMLANTTQQGF